MSPSWTIPLRAIARASRAVLFVIQADSSQLTSGVAGDPAGSGSWTHDFTVPSYEAGRTRCYTIDVEDADAPGGSSRSNRLYVTYGP